MAFLLQLETLADRYSILREMLHALLTFILFTSVRMVWYMLGSESSPSPS